MLNDTITHGKTRLFALAIMMTVVLPSLLVQVSPTTAQTGFDCIYVTQIPISECEALVALYYSTGGENWTDSRNRWLETTTPCSWSGVSCSNGSVVTLDKSYDGLVGDIPAEIGNLTNLTELNIARNQVTSLPSGIGGLTSLTSLSLGGNQLRTLPPEFGNLTNLTGLFLVDNQITSFPPEIGNLTKLTRILAYGNQLTTLPPEIEGLTSLTRAYFGGNQLRTLPPEIGNLPSLITLDVHSNQLSELPPEIGNLTTLGTLMVNGNNLSTLPAEIGNFNSLYMLDLSGNQLTTLPAEIGNINRINILDLSNNQLTTLPVELAQLSENIEELYLHNNPFTTLPPENALFADIMQDLYGFSCEYVFEIPVSECEALVAIYSVANEYYDDSNWMINRNPCVWDGVTCENEHVIGLTIEDFLISHMPPQLGDLTHLKWLNIDDSMFGTLIPTLPSEIENLVHLESISLLYMGVGLVTLPPELANLPNLTQIDLGSHTLRYMPTEIQTLINLGRITIIEDTDNNDTIPVAELPPLPELIDDFTCADVTEIPVAECEALVGIYNEMDGENWLGGTETFWLKLSPCGWFGVTCQNGRVTMLEMENFDLTGDVVAEIGDLTQLKSLRLNGNQITSLPPEIGNLTNLEGWLNLYHTQITMLPAEITELSMLLTTVAIPCVPDGLTVHNLWRDSSTPDCSSVGVSGRMRLNDDAGTPLVGIDVEISRIVAGVPMTTVVTTDEDGRFSQNIPPNTGYTVQVVDDAVNEMFLIETPYNQEESYVYDPYIYRDHHTTLDWVYLDPAGASISGQLWTEGVNDGVYAPPDQPLAGVDIEIATTIDGVPTTTIVTTDPRGLYSLEGIPLGTYTVTLSGSLDEMGIINIDPDNTLDGQTVIELGVNNYTSVENNFVFLDPAGIGIEGQLWLDSDDNGRLDASDEPLGGVDIEIAGMIDGVFTRTVTTTDEEGRYEINALSFSTYTVTVMTTTIENSEKMVFTDEPDAVLDGQTVITLDMTNNREIDHNFVLEVDRAQFSCADALVIPAAECSALVALYWGTNGDGWARSAKSDWLISTNPCAWGNITCDGGHVTRIMSNGSGLTGAIPSEIANLTHLTNLGLWDNQLTGLPAEIGMMDSLQHLEIGRNPWQTLPAEIGDLSNLIGLYLADTTFTDLPFSVEGMRSLEQLHLWGNRLTALPQGISVLSNLEGLIVRENQLTILPDGLTELTNLTRLDVRENPALTTLPDGLTDMPNLVQIQTNGTQIVCDAADCPNIPLAVGYRQQNATGQGSTIVVLLTAFALTFTMFVVKRSSL